MAAALMNRRRRARLRACRACGKTFRPVTNSKNCAECRRPRWPHRRLYIFPCLHCGQTVASGNARRLFCRNTSCRARHSDQAIVGQRQCVRCHEPFQVNRRQQRGEKQFCSPACYSEWQAEQVQGRWGTTA